MKNWNINGLIIEGICGTGKSTLLKRISRHPVFTKKQFQSSIILTEHHTQRILEATEKTRSLKKEDNLELLNGHVEYLEKINSGLEKMDWRERNRINHQICYLFERFHFTHVSHYDHMQWDFVKKLDERLSLINCKVVILKMSPESMKTRIIEERDAGWLKYLSRYGNTDDEIVTYFIKQQNELLKMSQKTKMPVLLIDTTEKEKVDLVENVIKFWGLYN